MTAADKKLIREEIAESYTKHMLSVLYKQQLKPFLEQTPEFSKLTKMIPEDKTPNKESLVRLLTRVYTDDEIFKRLLEFAPKPIAEMFNLLVWEGAARTDFLEEMFKVAIVKQKKNLYGSPATKINPLYYFFGLSHSYVYGYSWQREQEFVVFVPDALRKRLKQIIAPPEGYHLVPETSEPDTAVIFSDYEKILQDLPIITEYFYLGDISFLKNGSPSKASLRNTQAYCDIREFYPGRDKDLALLRTSLMLNYFIAEAQDSDMEPVSALKELFAARFAAGGSYSPLKTLLDHLKGRHQFSGYRAEENPVEDNLIALFSFLPPGEWIDVDKLERFAFLRDIDLKVVDYYAAERYLYYRKKADKSDYWGDQNVWISQELYPDFITKPLIQGICFLFAAFGLLDLAYNKPINKKFQDGKKNYLSKYDGLKYIRLNALGAYVLGVSKAFTSTSEVERAKVFLDDVHLIITLSMEDRLMEMVVQQFGAKIGKNRFKVDFGAFLKGCNSHEAVVDKISLFKERVEPDPPKIWLDFFNSALDRVDPLAPEEDFEVFKLRPNKELRLLIARDPEISKLILKAEDYHILVKKRHVSILKKRLEAHGYLLTL